MALQKLNTALQSLSKSVSNFNVGAVSTSDFKPIEEQIIDMRKILKVQKAHHLLLYAKHNAHSIREKPQEDINTTVSRLHEEVANLQIANVAVTLCLHSSSSEDIMYKDISLPEIKKIIQGCMRKLFILNDTLISLHISMEEALRNENDLKIACQKSLFEYRVFLREQENLRDQKLQETNPAILKNKKKLDKKLIKINIMKRLMTNMIATAGQIIVEKPFLFKMMTKHREVINIETIIEMARDTAASDTS